MGGKVSSELEEKRRKAFTELSGVLEPTVLAWRDAWKELSVRSVSIGVRFEDGTERWTIFGRRIPFSKESVT